MVFHPSIHSPIQGGVWGWSQSQLSWGKRQSTPWTGDQSGTGPAQTERHAGIHTYSQFLESTMSVT